MTCSHFMYCTSKVCPKICARRTDKEVQYSHDYYKNSSKECKYFMPIEGGRCPVCKAEI